MTTDINASGEARRQLESVIEHCSTIPGTLRRDLMGLAALAKEMLDEAEKLPEEQPSGQVYGIIDPDYGRAYTIIRKLAWEEGYAIGLHGSFTRDLDLIAVPWTDRPSDPEHLVRRIVASNAGLLDLPSNPGKKPQGRLVWTLLFSEFDDPRFIDLSIFRKDKMGQAFDDLNLAMAQAKDLLVDVYNKSSVEVKELIESRTGSWLVWGSDRKL